MDLEVTLRVALLSLYYVKGGGGDGGDGGGRGGDGGGQVVVVVFSLLKYIFQVTVGSKIRNYPCQIFNILQK